MTYRLLPVLLALCLSACGTRLPKDDAPASDLDVLGLSVRQQSRPVLLPNGREYCAELSNSQKEMDSCTGDLEDALYNSNRRAERTSQTVDRFIQREKLRRDPCNALEKVFSRKKCQRPK